MQLSVRECFGPCVQMIVLCTCARACLVAHYAHCERHCICMSTRVCWDGPDGLSGRMGSAWADRRRSAAAHMSSSNLYHFCRNLYHFVCITFVDRRNVDLGEHGSPSFTGKLCKKYAPASFFVSIRSVPELIGHPRVGIAQDFRKENRK